MNKPSKAVFCTMLGALLHATVALSMSEKKEIELGRQMHERIMAQYGTYPSPALQDYVQNIGAKLVAVSERSHRGVPGAALRSF